MGAAKCTASICRRTPTTTYVVDVRETLSGITARFYPADTRAQRVMRAECIVAANPHLRWALLGSGAISVSSAACLLTDGCPSGVGELMNVRLPGGMDLWLPDPASPPRRPNIYALPSGTAIPTSASSSQWFVFDLDALLAALTGKDVARTIANYTSPMADTLTFLTKTLRDLGWSGRLYVKQGADGTSYTILKGNQKLRTILRGTRYSSENPQLLELSLGPAGLKASAKGGAKITIFLFVAVEIIDLTAKFFMSDDFDWRDAAGTLTVDAAKVAVGAAVSYGTAYLIGAGSAGAVIAAGPVLVAITVGLVVGIALDKLDEHFHVTDRTVMALKAVTDSLRSQFDAAASDFAYEFDIGIRRLMGPQPGW
jgi:hypothetical protein